MRRLLIFLAIVFTLSGCASSPPRTQRSEFEDIPVPKGLELDWSRSTIIESPTIKAARLFYKGRVTDHPRGQWLALSILHNGCRERDYAGLRESGQLASGPDLRGLVLHLGGSVGDSGRRQGPRPGPLSTRGDR